MILAVIASTFQTALKTFFLTQFEQVLHYTDCFSSMRIWTERMKPASKTLLPGDGQKIVVGITGKVFEATRFSFQCFQSGSYLKQRLRAALYGAEESFIKHFASMARYIRL